MYSKENLKTIYNKAKTLALRISLWEEIYINQTTISIEENGNIFVLFERFIQLGGDVERYQIELTEEELSDDIENVVKKYDKLRMEEFQRVVERVEGMKLRMEKTKEEHERLQYETLKIKFENENNTHK